MAGSQTAGKGDRTSPSPHIVRIDVLRALAFLAVYIFHFTAVFPSAAIRWKGPFRDFTAWPAGYEILRPVIYGWLGVALFFVISGFCIHYANLQRGAFSARDFFWRRFLRLYPPYFVSLIVFVCLHRWLPFGYFKLWQIPAHLFLVHNLIHETFFGLNGSFWSLGVEAQFYLLYPLLLFLAARMGIGRSLVTALALNVASIIVISLTSQGAPALPVNSHWSFPLLTWCDWVLGAALAEAYFKGSRLFVQEKTWLVGSGMVLLVALNVKWLDAEAYLFASIFFAVAMQWYLLGKTPLNLLERALIPVGVISYSLFLWHEPLILLIANLGTGLGLGVSSWVHSVWTIGMTTLVLGVVATASYVLLEVRAPRWIRDWMKRRHLKAPPLPGPASQPGSPGN